METSLLSLLLWATSYLQPESSSDIFGASLGWSFRHHQSRAVSHMEQLVYIALLGALGCLCRYFLSGFVYQIFGTSFPYGTLAVNLIGAFLIGLIMEFSVRSAAIPPTLRFAVTIGFLGGLTTFSTFSFETFRLLEDGALLIAFVNVLVSVVACLTCTWVGIMVARAL